MATQECKECGGEVSGEAKTCPHCGAKGPGAEEFPIGLFILGVIVVPMVVLFLLGI